MKCEICGSSEPKPDHIGIDEEVWPEIHIGVIYLDAHPVCLRKAILAAGELIS